MSVVYFAEPAISLQPKYTDHPEGGIVGNALLFYEGEHVDNKGNKHLVPAERINLLAENTNLEYNTGREIPFMVEHEKKLKVSDEGDINQLGKMASPVYCRPIQLEDLPNQRLKHLIGKLGAFAQVHVQNCVDKVKNKTIKALSAGLDPVKNRFIEISAVAHPSLTGASLLFSTDFASHGLTDYEEAKKQIDAWSKPHAELQKKFDIFLGTLQAIASEEEDEIAFNPNNLKRKALEDFTEDLVNYLNISFEDEGEDASNIYNSNPYDPNLYKQQQANNYAEEETDNILNFNQTKRATQGEDWGARLLRPSEVRGEFTSPNTPSRTKRRRRGAS